MNKVELFNDHFQNFKLSTVAATLGVQVDCDSLHNAMYDIELTKAVFDIVTDINV